MKIYYTFVWKQVHWINGYNKRIIKCLYLSALNSIWVIGSVGSRLPAISILMWTQHRLLSWSSVSFSQTNLCTPAPIQCTETLGLLSGHYCKCIKPAVCVHIHNGLQMLRGCFFNLTKTFRLTWVFQIHVESSTRAAAWRPPHKNSSKALNNVEYLNESVCNFTKAF